MSIKKLDRHVFALYYDRTISLQSAVGKTILLEDKLLHHRIAHVLRFTPGSHAILFDREYHAEVIVEKIHKKSVEFFVHVVHLNKPLSPYIVLWLPLLKKQSLADAVYAAIEVGVSAIQLVITEKVQRSWGGAQELERLQAVAIAACEQAKNFSVPEIKAPVALQQILSTGTADEALRIFYDAAGNSFSKVFQGKETVQSAIVFVGPEGDLTLQEKETIKNSGFVFVRLTPTILRSPQAVALGVGMLRAALT